jgi:hypothetical protein
MSLSKRYPAGATAMAVAAASLLPAAAQEGVEDAWRDDIREIRNAAVDALDRMDADLVRLQESWKADVSGKEAFRASLRRNLAVDPLEIDNYCDRIALDDIHIWDRLDEAASSREDWLTAQQEAGTLTAQMIEASISQFIWEAHQIVIQRAEVHWRSHLHATGFGSTEVPGRAQIVAAEVQNELNRLAEEVQAGSDEVGGRMDAGEIDMGVFVQELSRLTEEAQDRITALLAEERWRIRLDQIKAALEPARAEHADLIGDWSSAVASSLTFGSAAWRAGEAERVRVEANRWITDALDQLWAESDPRSFHRAVTVAPYTMWNVLMQDQAGGDVAVVLGEPLAFAERVGGPAAGGAAAQPGDLPRPLKPDSTPQLIQQVCGVAIVDRPSVDRVNGVVRTLCVYGVGLFDLEGELGSLAESDDHVSYEVIAARAGAVNIRDEEPHASLWRAGIQDVSREVEPARAAAFRVMDAVLVRATIAPGVLPGLHTFRIGSAECTWALDVAAASARIELVRLLPWRTADVVDRPDEFFVHDSMCVQLETSVPLHAEEIPLVLLRNRQPVTFTGDAAAITPTGEAGIVIAHRLEEHPTIFRTRSFTIDDAGRPTPPDRLDDFEIATTASEGDTFWATTDGFLFADPVADSAVVLQSPDRIKSIDGKGMLFTEAIRDASLMHDLQLTSLDVNREDVVDTVWHTYPTQLRIHEIQFSVADHAAMLMLKRTFLRMAQDYLAQLKSIAATDALIRAHIPSMIEQMQAGVREASAAGDMRLFPLGLNRVTFPMNTPGVPRDVLTEYGLYRWRESDGFSILSNAFSPEGERFFRNRADFDQWQFDCTKEALRLQIEATQGAIDHANSCDDDEPEELLEFTGRGFDPIVERIMPRLVEFKADPVTRRMRWVPHQRARELVTDLTRKLFEHDTAGSGARASQEALLAVVTGCGVGLSGHLVGKAVLAATAAVSIGYAGADVITLQANKAEVQFASDAVEIIGRDRLNVALRDRDISATPYITFAMSVFGFRMDIADYVRAIRISAARKAAERAIVEVRDEGLDAWFALTAEERALLFVLYEEAHQARKAGKALSSAQTIAEAAGRRVEQDMFGRHPWGWPYDDVRADRATRAPMHGIGPPGNFNDTLVDAAPSRPNVDVNAPTSPDVNPPTGGGAAGHGDSAAAPGANAPSPDAPAVGGGAAADDVPTAPPGPMPRQYMAREAIPDRMPMPGYTVIDPGTGRTLVVGEPLGHGVYATTYELLDEAGAPTGQVIKFFREPYEKTATKFLRDLEDMEVGLREAGTQELWDPTDLPEVIDRVMHGQKCVREADIPHMSMVELDTPLGLAGRNHDPPFVVQQILPNDGTISFFKEGVRLTEPQQRAVVRLYKRMAEKGLIWQDGNINNIFFRQEGDELVAGVFDPDMIVRFEEDIANEFLRDVIHACMTMGSHKRIGSIPVLFGRVNETPPPDVLRRFNASAHEYMAKMLERWTYVFFEELAPAQQRAAGRAGDFMGGIVDVRIAMEEFGDLQQWVKKQVEREPGSTGTD